MTKASSIGDLVSIVELIIPKDLSDKPITDPEYCQEQLDIFFDQHHLDYHPLGDNKFAIRQLTEFEMHLYQGMFGCFGRNKIQGKKRLDQRIHIKIT